MRAFLKHSFLFWVSFLIAFKVGLLYENLFAVHFAKKAKCTHVHSGNHLQIELLIFYKNISLMIQQIDTVKLLSCAGLVPVIFNHFVPGSITPGNFVVSLTSSFCTICSNIERDSCLSVVWLGIERKYQPLYISD